jgi:hypothetical protein
MIKFNPFTGNFDLVGSSGTDLPVSDKLTYALAALAAYDRVVDITYLDEGTIYRRISSVSLESAGFPDSEIEISVSYLGAGTMDQRIDEISITGTVFGTDVLKKVYQYNQVGIRHEMAGFQYQVA